MGRGAKTLKKNYAHVYKSETLKYRRQRACTLKLPLCIHKDTRGPSRPEGRGGGGVAATPEVWPDRPYRFNIRPPRGGLGLLPAGAPLHGGPLWARMAGGVAPLGGVRPTAGRHPLPPLVGSGRGAAAYGRGDRGHVPPNVRTAGWHGPDRPE